MKKPAGIAAMNQPPGFPVKRAFLYALIGSVSLSAVLGILAILSGQFGWFEIRILLTTVTIAGASICGLSCGAYLATMRGRILPLAGVALTIASAAMIIAGMWQETMSQGYWKLAVSASVLAVACAHLSLLSMAQLAAGFQWSRAAAHIAIFGVAALVILMILAELFALGMFQLLGVAAILDAAITVLIPILHRLSKTELAGDETGATAELASIDAEIAQLKERIAELERMKLRGK